MGYPFFFPPGRDAPRAGGQGGYDFNGKRMKITFAGRDHPRAPRPARGARGHGGEARGEGSFFSAGWRTVVADRRWSASASSRSSRRSRSGSRATRSAASPFFFFLSSELSGRRQSPLRGEPTAAAGGGNRLIRCLLNPFLGGRHRRSRRSAGEKATQGAFFLRFGPCLNVLVRRHELDIVAGGPCFLRFFACFFKRLFNLQE